MIFILKTTELRGRIHDILWHFDRCGYADILASGLVDQPDAICISGHISASIQSRISIFIGRNIQLEIDLSHGPREKSQVTVFR